MRKTKEQKGITLIALIITIIVLLILAVVAISAVQDDGIINYAKNAREEYGKAGVNENTTLQNYLDKIKENVPTGTGSTQKPAEEDEVGTPISFTIGETEYQGTSNQTWSQWCEGREDYYVNKWEEGLFFISPKGQSAKIVRCDKRCTSLVNIGDLVGNCPVCHGNSFFIDVW